ncbi:MAG TPA: hypothetical protein VD913_01750, partial [bacterium]|nr:hypothetical protein [bacterium]
STSDLIEAELKPGGLIREYLDLHAAVGMPVAAMLLAMAANHKTNRPILERLVSVGHQIPQSSATAGPVILPIIDFIEKLRDKAKAGGRSEVRTRAEVRTTEAERRTETNSRQLANVNSRSETRVNIHEASREDILAALESVGQKKKQGRIQSEIVRAIMQKKVFATPAELVQFLKTPQMMGHEQRALDFAARFEVKPVEIESDFAAQNLPPVLDHAYELRPDLLSIKKVIQETIDWLIVQDYPHPDVLKNYRDVLDQRLAEVPVQQEQQGRAFQKTRTGVDGAPVVRISPVNIYRNIEDMRHLNLPDFFMENFVSVIIREAWGYQLYPKRPTSVEISWRDHGKKVLYEEFRRMQPHGFLWPGSEASAYFARYQEQITQLAALAFAAETFEAMHQFEALKWLRERGMLDPARIRNLIAGQNNAAFRKRLEWLRQKQEELILTDGNFEKYLETDLRDMGQYFRMWYGGSNNLTAAAYGIFFMLEFERFHRSGGIEGIDPKVFEIMRTGRGSLRSEWFSSTAKRLLPVIEKVLDEWLRSRDELYSGQNSITETAAAATNSLLPGLDLALKPGLASIKIAIQQTLDWLIRQGYPHPQVLRNYQEAVQEALEMIPGFGVEFAKSSGAESASSILIYLDSERIYKRMTALQQIGSGDLFFENFVSTLTAEAWGFRDVQKNAMRLDKLRQEANHVLRREGSRILKGPFHFPGKAVSQFLSKKDAGGYQEDIVRFAESYFAHEFIEREHHLETLQWGSDHGFYSAARAAASLKTQALSSDHPLLIRRWMTQQELDAKSDPVWLLATLLMHLGSSNFRLYQEGHHEDTHVLVVFYYFLLEIERFLNSSGAEGLDEEIINLIAGRNDPPYLGMFYSSAARLWPGVAKVTAEIEDDRGDSETAAPVRQTPVTDASSWNPQLASPATIEELLEQVNAAGISGGRLPRDELESILAELKAWPVYLDHGSAMALLQTFPLTDRQIEMLRDFVNKSKVGRAEVRSGASGDEDHSTSGIILLKSDLPMTGIGGEPYTNEDVTAFISGLDKIDIQGGGFLGVGSFHNLDIALDRGASAIVLVDYAPEVVERNLSLLGFIERAENPGELRLMIEKEGWQDDLEAIRTAESPQRSRIGASLGRTPLLWYDDEDYFKRLKQLMRERRIAVAYADLAQPESMKPVGEFFIQTGIPLRLINLSNVEMHIERGVGIKGLAHLGDALKAAGANADTLVTAAMPFRYIVNFVQRYKRREMILIPRVVPLGMKYIDESNYSAGWLNVLRTMGDIEEGRLLTRDLDSHQPVGSIVRGYLAQIESRAQKPPLRSEQRKPVEQPGSQHGKSPEAWFGTMSNEKRGDRARSEVRIETKTAEELSKALASIRKDKEKRELITEIAVKILKENPREKLDAIRAIIQTLELTPEVASEINQILAVNAKPGEPLKLNNEKRTEIASLLIFLNENKITLGLISLPASVPDGNVFIISGFHATRNHADRSFKAISERLPALAAPSAAKPEIPEIIFHLEDIHPNMLQHFLAHPKVKSPEDQEAVTRLYSQARPKFREIASTIAKSLREGKYPHDLVSEDPFSQRLYQGILSIRQKGYAVRIFHEDPEPNTWWFWERSAILTQAARDAFLRGDENALTSILEKIDTWRYRADRRRDFEEESRRISDRIQQYPKATHFIIRGTKHEYIEKFIHAAPERKHIVRVVPDPQNPEQFESPLSILHRRRLKAEFEKLPAVSPEEEKKMQLQEILFALMQGILSGADPQRDLLESAASLNQLIQSMTSEDILRIVRSFQGSPNPDRRNDRLFEIYYRIKANFPHAMMGADPVGRLLEESIEKINGKPYSPVSLVIPAARSEVRLKPSDSRTSRASNLVASRASQHSRPTDAKSEVRSQFGEAAKMIQEYIDYVEAKLISGKDEKMLDDFFREDEVEDFLRPSNLSPAAKDQIVSAILTLYHVESKRISALDFKTRLKILREIVSTDPKKTEKPKKIMPEEIFRELKGFAMRVQRMVSAQDENLFGTEYEGLLLLKQIKKIDSYKLSAKLRKQFGYELLKLALLLPQKHLLDEAGWAEFADGSVMDLQEDQEKGWQEITVELLENYLSQNEIMNYLSKLVTKNLLAPEAMARFKFSSALVARPFADINSIRKLEEEQELSFSIYPNSVIVVNRGTRIPNVRYQVKTQLPFIFPDVDGHTHPVGGNREASKLDLSYADFHAKRGVKSFILFWGNGPAETAIGIYNKKRKAFKWFTGEKTVETKLRELGLIAGLSRSEARLARKPSTGRDVRPSGAHSKLPSVSSKLRTAPRVLLSEARSELRSTYFDLDRDRDWGDLAGPVRELLNRDHPSEEIRTFIRAFPERVYDVLYYSMDQLSGREGLGEADVFTAHTYLNLLALWEIWRDHPDRRTAPGGGIQARLESLPDDNQISGGLR